MTNHMDQDQTAAWWGLIGTAPAAPMQLWVLPATRDLTSPHDQAQPSYRLGSRVRVALQSARAGYLLLLHRGTTGNVYCLCPSWFARETSVEANRPIVLPQDSSPWDAFQITGSVGHDDLLAILTDTPLLFDNKPLNWLPPDPTVPARRLVVPDDIVTLQHALESLGRDRWWALATSYAIIA